MALSDYIVPAVGGSILMSLCWILGRFGHSFLWIFVLIGLSVWNSKMWRRRERRVLALQQAAMREKEVVLGQLRDLPAWVQFPDIERVEWLNKVIFQLWPYIGEFSKEFIKQQVEPRIKALLPGPFKSFAFEGIDMGDIPLRVGGIKVYTENVGRDRIIMDMDVAYAGDCEFVVSIGAFRAGLRQMQFKGKLRAILKPCIPRPPMIGGVSCFFLDEPTIDFDLTGLGELVELPGLLGAVRSVINSQVAAICVLPNEIVVPLTAETDVVKLYFPEPDGVVRIHIYEARNLEDRDMTILKGKSDPYARVSVGSQFHKTKTIDNSLNPIWDEYFEASVEQASGQRINIELFDEDVASADEFLGRMSIDLAVVRSRGFIDEWYPLEGVQKGDLHLRIFWLDLVMDSTTIGMTEHERERAALETSRSEPSPARSQPLNRKEAKLKAAQSVLSNALLMVYVDGVTGLPSIKKSIEPDPYVELTVGKISQKTFPRPKTPNPLYQTKFLFFVNNIDHQILKVEAKDEATGGRSLGETTYPLRHLLAEERLEMHQAQFDLSMGPHSSPLILTLRLRFLRHYSVATREAVNVMAKIAENGSAPEPRPFGSPSGTNQLILPTLELNGSSKGEEAWRNAALSSGASTPNSVASRGNFATKAFDRFAKSNGVLAAKLRRRKPRTLSTALPGSYGKLEFSLAYSTEKHQLLVTIHEAKDLKSANDDHVADPYVKVRLMKDNVVKTQQSTLSKLRTLDPTFEQGLTFIVPPDDLTQYVLVFDVKDAVNYGLFSSRPVLGQLIYDLTRFHGSEFRGCFDLTQPCYDTLGSTKGSIKL